MDSSLELTSQQETALVVSGCISGALSLIALCCVILHDAFELFSARRLRSLGWAARAGGFNRQLVFVLMWIELFFLVARMMGRRGTMWDAEPLCQIQGAMLQGFGVAGCVWITCLSFNLYRWVVYGDSETKQWLRLWRYVGITVALAMFLVVFEFSAKGYSASTFSCFLKTRTRIMLHYFLPTVVAGVGNIALLISIRVKLKKRVEWNHPVAGNRVTAAIRRKSMLYILIYVLHRAPPFVFRVLPERTQTFFTALVALIIMNLEGCSYAIVYGGLFKFLNLDDEYTDDENNTASQRCSEMSVSGDDMVGKRGKVALLEDIDDGAQESMGTIESAVTSVSTLINVTAAPSASRISRRMINAANPTEKKASSFFERHLLGTNSNRDKSRPRSMGIFVSTFNMGEHDVRESELIEWIPIGYDVYVIGVQECMNLVDLQSKVRRHLVDNTGQDYVYFSHDIGKRATALGYHGYIALTVFVLNEAIQMGRFEIPQQEATSKHAQELYRGKSLLMFGRASNKGAVGIRFRYGNASFAFVTCHFASDSSSIPGMKKRSFGNKKGETSSDGTTILEATTTPLPAPAGKLPPSKIQRRNQDASEVLQHLCLDEEGGDFGFPLLHHHSFMLGDMNYRMSRQNASPTEILDRLHQICRTKSFERSSTGEDHGAYRVVTTPSMLRLVPGLPDALAALIGEHDELTSLREARKLFFGFEEPAITFMPTFRRNRGELLDSYDMESLLRNYSLVASGGGMRVPSYTDRILHTSLPGRAQDLQCLYYDSCESVTTSDHKPVSAVYRITMHYDDDPVPQPSVPSTIPAHSYAGASLFHRKHDGTGDVRVKIEFRSIQWLDAIEIGNASWFGQLENVEFGFLFPLPCEDVFSRQRKLQEVAEHITWGEGLIKKDIGVARSSKTSGSGVPLVPPSGSNFHVVPWNRFVENGIRCATRINMAPRKHAAVMIRTRSRPSRTSRAKPLSPQSRIRAKSTSLLQPRPPSPKAAAFTSSGSFGMSLGFGAFTIEEIGKRQETQIPLTLGGNLVGRLHVRVSMRDLHDQLASL